MNGRSNLGIARPCLITPFYLKAKLNTTNWSSSQVAIKFAKAYPVVLLARNPDNYESIVKEIKSSGDTPLESLQMFLQRRQ